MELEKCAFDWVKEIKFNGVNKLQKGHKKNQNLFIYFRSKKT